ncbi:MAG: hypothetical protein CMJ58_11980 [Planctomycetaceae bacterium]|nr:hypothetical protein [Planctomycetaceae bacterium]
MEQLSVAAQCFAVQLDFKKLLGEIAAHAQQILPVDRVVAYSHIDGRLWAEAAYPQPIPTGGRVSEDVRWCVRYLKPRVTNTPQPDVPDIRNSICVPLLASQNRVLAVIEFRNKRSGGLFTEEDAQVAQCLARIAASALDRARLFFRMEEWRQSVETLLSFNATVNQQLEPEQMVRELVTNVIGFLEADGGLAGILIRTEAGLQMQCDGLYYAGLWSAFCRRWAPDEGIPGTVLETQFPYLTRDYKSDALADRDLCRSFDLGPCVCVPIKNPQEEVLGFFQLHRRAGEPEFTWQDAAFLEQLGGTAAVAIENARLVKSLELKNQQVKNLSRHHVHRLEQERRHIARELHDQTGQVLIGLKLRLQILDGLLSGEQSEVKGELTELRRQVNQAAVQLKDLSKRLRPPLLDELGFEASVRQLVSEFRQHASFVIGLEFASTPELSSEAETALFRTVQECLTNVAKHSRASRVDIRFGQREGRQVLRIVDDGDGFDPQAASTGLGHIGIKERVSMLGGRMHIETAVGAGVCVEVTLPGEQSA